MDARLTVLTAFPPAAGIDNEEYYQNSQQHAKRVRELIRDNAQWIRESADDILKVGTSYFPKPGVSVVQSRPTS